MSHSQPVRPEDVTPVAPDLVIDVFNALITSRYKGRPIIISQDDVIKELLLRDPELTREYIFDNNWLDVEDVYRAAGWLVIYDKPGYNESYRPRFTFSRQ